MPLAPQARDRSATENACLKTATNRLRENPRHVDAPKAVGAYFLAHDQAEEAIERFHRITRIDPACPGIWRLEAEAFEVAGDRENVDPCRRGANRHA